MFVAVGCVFSSIRGDASSYPFGSVDRKLVASQQGDEKLVYRLSWSGGVKIGNVWIEVSRVGEDANRLEIAVRVQSSGLLHLAYPVDDSFSTILDAETRLPVSYRVHQAEGRNYTATRYTEYDQENGSVRYQKNEEEPRIYKVNSEMHNEFTSFFMNRLLILNPGKPQIIPTFADGELHEVVVHVEDPIRIHSSLRGDVNVLPVRPVMDFKGLYDKDGDTEIWLTDDDCRIPVRIVSKILIGSITAELVSYSNPFCKEPFLYHASVPAEGENQENLRKGY